MSDAAIRLLIVGAVIAIALGVAWAFTRLQRRTHPGIANEGLDLPGGLVVFTSTACANCKRALAVAKETGAPLREYTWELEPHVLEHAGVESVPLIVVVDQNGRVGAHLSGVPKRRKLRRALARAGW